MQLEGRRYNTVAEIQNEMQKVRDPLRENDFQAGFQSGRNARTGV